MAGHRTELAGYDAMVGLARRLSLGPSEADASEVTAGVVAEGQVA